MAIDVRNLSPSELVRVLNSTQLGEVITPRVLKRQRDAAGFRIGQGSKVDLYRYVAWLIAQRHDVQWSADAPKTYAELARRFQVSTKTIHAWKDNYADWPDREADGTFDVDKFDAFCKSHRIGTYNPNHGAQTSEQPSSTQQLMRARSDLTTERVRRERAQATQAEIDLARAAGDIVLAADVVSLYEQTAAIVMETIRSVVDVHDREMPEQLPSDDESWQTIRRRILEADRKLLKDIATALQELTLT